MTINLKDIQLRIDLSFSTMTKKRFKRWRYGYYNLDKRTNKKSFSKMSKRLHRHLRKPKIRQLLFKK